MSAPPLGGGVSPPLRLSEKGGGATPEDRNLFLLLSARLNAGRPRGTCGDPGAAASLVWRQRSKLGCDFM